VIPAHDGEEGEEGARLTLQLPDGKSQLERTQTIAGKVHVTQLKKSTNWRRLDIQAGGKRLIFRQTNGLVLLIPLWLMEFLMESTSFLQFREMLFWIGQD
jgi:hypothetical protein